MNSHIFLYVLYNLLCSVSTIETGANLLDLELSLIQFKENFYEINDHNSFVNINNANKYSVEESTSHSKFYNQSIIFNFLCYARNFTDRYQLRWHHFIGNTEVGSASLETSEPSKNYTLSLLMRSYDNESKIFCTASESYTETRLNRTNDLTFRMNDFLNEDVAIIAVCKGNYSEGSSEPCEIGNRHNRDVQLTQRIKKEYSSVYGSIPSVYYNEHFPTITHRCSKASNSILRAPDGTAQVNFNETFTFNKTDNGTVIYCSRFISSPRKHGVRKDQNEYGIKRETYNARIYVYNQLYWNDKYYQNNHKPTNLFTVLIVIGSIVIVMAVVLNVVFCVYRRLKKRHNKE